MKVSAWWAAERIERRTLRRNILIPWERERDRARHLILAVVINGAGRDGRYLHESLWERTAEGGCIMFHCLANTHTHTLCLLLLCQVAMETEWRQPPWALREVAAQPPTPCGRRDAAASGCLGNCLSISSAFEWLCCSTTGWVSCINQLRGVRRGRYKYKFWQGLLCWQEKHKIHILINRQSCRVSWNEICRCGPSVQPHLFGCLKQICSYRQIPSNVKTLLAVCLIYIQRTSLLSPALILSRISAVAHNCLKFPPSTHKESN